MCYAENPKYGKNLFDNTEGLQCTGSSLHSLSQSHPLKVKCVLCRASHFCDNCSVKSDYEAIKKVFVQQKKYFCVYVHVT